MKVRCIITGEEFEIENPTGSQFVIYISAAGLKMAKIQSMLEGSEGVVIPIEGELDAELFMRSTDYQDEAKKIANVSEKNKRKFVNPKDIYEHLEKTVIGQEHAKKVLSVAVFNHFLRIDSNDLSIGNRTKSNVLLIGPSGSGKTFLVEQIAKFLDVPVAFGDATTLTRAGYVGEDVESLIQALYQNADRDLKRTERGIIFIDEFDKIRATAENSHTLDVGGREVQHALLKLLEGSVVQVNVDGYRHAKASGESNGKIDTSKILFICSGAFVGLERQINRRLNPQRQAIGFTAETVQAEDKIDNPLAKITNQDLIKYGFIPEVIGRIPVIATLNEHTEESLVKILTEADDNLTHQYEDLFNAFKVKLHFSNESLHKAAKVAIKRGVGARGLKSIFEGTLLDAMYVAPSDKSIKSVLILADSIADSDEVAKSPLYLDKLTADKLVFKESRGIKLNNGQKLLAKDLKNLLAKQIAKAEKATKNQTKPKKPLKAKGSVAKKPTNKKAIA